MTETNYLMIVNASSMNMSKITFTDQGGLNTYEKLLDLQKVNGFIDH